MFEPKVSLVATPWGVKTESSANNAVGALRGDTPVFHPKAREEETEMKFYQKAWLELLWE